MGYWERKGWDDGWIGWKAKSVEWFQGAQQQEFYELYMRGFRAGRRLRLENLPRELS